MPQYNQVPNPQPEDISALTQKVEEVISALKALVSESSNVSMLKLGALYQTLESHDIEHLGYDNDWVVADASFYDERLEALRFSIPNWVFVSTLHTVIGQLCAIYSPDTLKRTGGADGVNQLLEEVFGPLTINTMVDGPKRFIDPVALNKRIFESECNSSLVQYFLHELRLEYESCLHDNFQVGRLEDLPANTNSQLNAFLKFVSELQQVLFIPNTREG